MRRTATIAGVLLLAGLAGAARAQVDDGVIRLRPEPAPGPESTATVEPGAVQIGAPRNGFDYGAFQARLESLWFQRKTLLASGREDDALEQLERIRSSCASEGIKRLDLVAGALVSEARRDVREGSYERALSSLRMAAAVDPNRPQIHLLRSAIYWKADHAYLSAAGELFTALRATLLRSFRDLSIFHQLTFLVGISLVVGAVLYSMIMVARYQVPLRHDVEEWWKRRVGRNVAVAFGWGVLFLPLLTGVGAGWIAVYWIAIAFRYMSRQERTVAATLLIIGALTLPAYRASIALFGAAADPAVRTTLLSAGGEYDPNRVVRLRELVDAHPDDPVYRFLLAGLYKNGRYFEEAFAEYNQALEIDGSLYPAHVNTGNIFYSTGQYAEAIVSYGRALDLEPASFLAHYNMHLAQSESFHFSDAEESLHSARGVDSERVARLLASEGDRPTVQDAALELPSIWEAALGGRTPLPGRRPADWDSDLAGLPLADPIGIACAAALLACGVLTFRGRNRDPARRCIRCGRPFCQRCRNAKAEGREYCTQCLHLFVLGDGLAPGAKSTKLYEVEAHERMKRRTRKVSSLVLPGVAHLLRGRTAWGLVLIVLWVASLVAIRPALLFAIAAPIGIELQPELLTGASSVPVSTEITSLALMAFPLLPLVWIAGNTWRWRRGEA